MLSCDEALLHLVFPGKLGEFVVIFKYYETIKYSGCYSFPNFSLTIILWDKVEGCFIILLSPGGY